MQSANDRKGAAVKFPPPLIFLGFILVSAIIDYFYPLSFDTAMPSKMLGYGVIIVALLIVFIASRSFKKVKTNIEPWKPTSKIVSEGVFAYSRNPIYLAFALVPIGLGIILGSVWILLSFIPAVICTYFVAIKKEEQYLEQKFGSEYLDYKTKGRRWL